jgi:hypothetical protein
MGAAPKHTDFAVNKEGRQKTMMKKLTPRLIWEYAPPTTRWIL